MGNAILTINTSNNGMTPAIAPLFTYENITPDQCATKCNQSNNCTAMRFVTNNPYSFSPSSTSSTDTTTILNSCSIYTGSNIGLIPYTGSGSSTMASLMLLCPTGQQLSNNNNSCSSCPSGSYCTGGSSSAVQCPAGSYCPNGTGAISCPIGSYCPAGSTAAIPCPAGSYCPSGGLSSGIQCPAGSYCSGQGGQAPVPCSFGRSVTTQAQLLEACPAGTVTEPNTVICTELYRRGFMPEDIYAADQKFGRSLDIVTYNNYRVWADPIVLIMKREDILGFITVSLAKFIALPWAYAMAEEMKVPDIQSSMFGRFLLKYGIKTSNLFGSVRSFILSFQKSV